MMRRSAKLNRRRRRSGTPWFALVTLVACVGPWIVACDSNPEAETEAIPDLHDRPIVERDGKTLLWAGEDDAGKVDWFDMTDGLIDPHRFQFGIGKDTIDAPEFVQPDDPRLAERGVTRDTPVLGVKLEGIARAYPVALMDMHEVVNDDYDGKAYAVFW